MESLTDVIPLGTLFTFSILSLIVLGFAYYFMAKKAGLSNAWWSFVPILNSLILFDILKKSKWNIILIFIPFVGFVFSIIWLVELLRAFDRNPAMILAMLLIPGFTYFYMIYLGVSSKVKYVY